MNQHTIHSVKNETGMTFKVGEEVGHQSSEGTATIESFEVEEGNQIIAQTTKGNANISYLIKQKK